MLQLLGSAGLLWLLLASFGARAADITGYWLKPGTYGNSAVIQIYPNGNRSDGKIVAVERTIFSPGDKSVDGVDVPEFLFGKVKTDVRNPYPALRSRPIQGLQIINGFRPDGDAAWTGASIYNPEDGEIYHCKATLSDDGKTLTVRGYIGVPLLGKSQVWTRVDSPSLPGWQ